jgi:DNA-directed RNA polymerase specialized sigma24 family protein
MQEPIGMFTRITPEEVLEIATRAARRIARSPEQVEEWAATAVLTCCEKARLIDTATTPRGMAWAVATGSIRNAQRANSRGRELPLKDWATDYLRAEDLALRSIEGRSEINHILRMFSPREREVVGKLALGADLTGADRVALHRARRKLRREGVAPLYSIDL